MRRMLMMVLLAGVLGLASCSSGGSSGSSLGTGSETTAGGAAKRAVEGQVEAEGQIGASGAAACSTEKRTVETGVKAYRAVNDEVPATAADLVTSGLLREVPVNWELGPPDADGSPTVVPSKAGLAAGCQVTD